MKVFTELPVSHMRYTFAQPSTASKYPNKHSEDDKQASKRGSQQVSNHR